MVSRKRSDKYKAVRKRVKRDGKSFMTTVYKLKKSSSKRRRKK